MSFGASADIWGDALLPDVQHNLAELARTIAKYEPVSMLVRRQDRATAERMVQGANVTLVGAAVHDGVDMRHRPQFRGECCQIGGARRR
jgi:agmatine deiminase